MQSKYAIFVDAGYLLAASGKVVTGSASRSQIECDYDALIEFLVGLAQSDSGGHQRLRTYWYDGAKDGLPTPDHLVVSRLSYVKLRLGRLNANNEQKGVDSLIYRDLMTLARERAIERAYLVSGDEDLRQGVIAAQDMGVQVVLVGVGNTAAPNQSDELVREVDDQIDVRDEDVRKYVKRRTSDPSRSPATRRDGIETVVPEGPKEFTAATEKRAVQSGERFAKAWVDGATKLALAALLDGSPRIPQEIDGPLLEAARVEFGLAIDRGEPIAQDIRRAIRQGFWEQIGVSSSPEAR